MQEESGASTWVVVGLQLMCIKIVTIVNLNTFLEWDAICFERILKMNIFPNYEVVKTIIFIHLF